MDTKEAGKLGGSRNTPAQNAARARNAKLGGRPRKKYPAGMDYQHNDARIGQPVPVSIVLNRKPEPAPPSPAPTFDDFNQETGSEVE